MITKQDHSAAVALNQLQSLWEWWETSGSNLAVWTIDWFRYWLRYILYKLSIPHDFSDFKGLFC